MTTIFRIAGILLVSCGAGLLTYGAATTEKAFRAPFGLNVIIGQPSEAIAYGTGGLVCGLLVLLMLGGRRAEPAAPAGKL